METRTLYALVAALLIVPMGTAVAQEPGDVAAPAADRPHPTYKVGILPAEQWAAPGTSATYRVVIEARNETLVTLAVHAPDLVSATLSASEVRAAPGHPGHATLTVTSRENASAQKLPIVIVAKSASGEVHEARATLILREKPTERPCPAASDAPNDATAACVRPKPTPPPQREPRPYAVERPHDRADELEKRLEMLILRAERYLAKLEAVEHARPAPKPAPIADVTLRLSDANVTLGQEGRRVALLIENGAHEGRVPLELRYDAASGWKVELEKDMVKLRPHERTYVWVLFRPDGAGSVSYAIHAGNATAGVQGVATFPGPSTA